MSRTDPKPRNVEEMLTSEQLVQAVAEWLHRQGRLESGAYSRAGCLVSENGATFHARVGTTQEFQQGTKDEDVPY